MPVKASRLTLLFLLAKKPTRPALLLAIGFVVIVNTRRGDYENLAIFYSIAREMAKARFDVNTLESASVTMVIERLLYLLNDYRSVELEFANEQCRDEVN